MGNQFGKEIAPKVLELKTKGYTLRKIGEELGCTKTSIKNFLYH